MHWKSRLRSLRLGTGAQCTGVLFCNCTAKPQCTVLGAQLLDLADVVFRRDVPQSFWFILND